MSKTKKARAGIAVPTQAMETGAACRQTTTSTTNSITPPAENQIFRVADLLLHGAENAVPRRDLMALTGFTDRELRLKIETERRQGIPILSDNIHGYFLPGSEMERVRCVRSLRSRAREIEATAAAIEKAVEPD